MVSAYRALLLRPSTVLFLVFGILLMTLAMAELRGDPGYMLVTVGGYAVETSVIVAAISAFVLATVLVWVYRLFEWIFDGKRRQNAARKKTTKGLVALAEGNWDSAEKLLAKAAPGQDVPLINYLTAAQAAHEQGEDDRRDEYLRLADETTKGVDVAIGLTKARLQFDSKQWEQCLATLMMLKKKETSPSYPAVLKLLAEVLIKLEDWKQLKELLPELKKGRILDRGQYETLALKCYEGWLRSLARNDNKQASLQALKQAWNEVPRKLKSDARLTGVYAGYLVELGYHGEAEQVLMSQLRKQWDDELIRLYGMIEGDDLEKQLLWAEGFLQEHPGNANLLLTLGRLSLRNQNWDKARDYFEASIKSRNTPEAYGELGRLLSHMGEHQASNDCFQKALAMSSNPLPDLPMPS